MSDMFPASGRMRGQAAIAWAKLTMPMPVAQGLTAS